MHFVKYILSVDVEGPVPEGEGYSLGDNFSVIFETMLPEGTTITLPDGNGSGASVGRVTPEGKRESPYHVFLSAQEPAVMIIYLRLDTDVAKGHLENIEEYNRFCNAMRAAGWDHIDNVLNSACQDVV